MAVEAATQRNPFPQLMIQDRDLLNPMMNQANGINLQQMRLPATVCDLTSVNADSGLTYNISAPRKRQRDDSVNQFYEKNVFPQMNQYQSEIDVIISQYTKKIKLEFEERQKQHSRLLAAAIGDRVMKKMKEKEETIQRMGKVNLILQDRVRNLYVENQLLRDLAQSNEATANSLRSNLEQVLLQVGGGGGEERVSGAAVDEDAESCCGSTGNNEDGCEGRNCYSDRRCCECGDREASVLLLPCRHLCLCNVCGIRSQQLQACPVCNGSMTATLHVNLS